MEAGLPINHCLWYLNAQTRLLMIALGFRLAFTCYSHGGLGFRVPRLVPLGWGGAAPELLSDSSAEHCCLEAEPFPTVA